MRLEFLLYIDSKLLCGTEVEYNKHYHRKLKHLYRLSHFGVFSTDTAFEVTFVKGKLLLNLIRMSTLMRHILKCSRIL